MKNTTCGITRQPSHQFHPSPSQSPAPCHANSCEQLEPKQRPEPTGAVLSNKTRSVSNGFLGASVWISTSSAGTGLSMTTSTGTSLDLNIYHLPPNPCGKMAGSPLSQNTKTPITRPWQSGWICRRSQSSNSSRPGPYKRIVWYVYNDSYTHSWLILGAKCCYINI